LCNRHDLLLLSIVLFLILAFLNHSQDFLVHQHHVGGFCLLNQVERFWMPEVARRADTGWRLAGARRSEGARRAAEGGATGGHRMALGGSEAAGGGATGGHWMALGWSGVAGGGATGGHRMALGGSEAAAQRVDTGAQRMAERESTEADYQLAIRQLEPRLAEVTAQRDNSLQTAFAATAAVEKSARKPSESDRAIAKLIRDKLRPFTGRNRTPHHVRNFLSQFE
ncbi:MAG: hypothetical protein BJ554DRAFT_475, partial [Olpidium bornovanus]